MTDWAKRYRDLAMSIEALADEWSRAKADREIAQSYAGELRALLPAADTTATKGDER